MSEQLTAEERARAALTELYGHEERLIVINTFKGVLSIGFGERGELPGVMLERSHLPIVLTDMFPRETWLKSADFRQAFQKGRLRLVKPEEHDTMLRQESTRQAEMNRLAALDKDRPVPQKFDAVVDDMSQPPQPLDVDENGQPVNLSAEAFLEKIQEYDRSEPASQPVVEVRGGRFAKAEALVDRMRRGALTPAQALQELDKDATLFSDDDLAYVASQSVFQGVKALALQIAGERRKGK